MSELSRISERIINQVVSQSVAKCELISMETSRIVCTVDPRRGPTQPKPTQCQALSDQRVAERLVLYGQPRVSVPAGHRSVL